MKNVVRSWMRGLLLQYLIPAKLRETVTHLKCSFVLSKQIRKLSKSSQYRCLRANPQLWMMAEIDRQGNVKVWGAGILFTVENSKELTGVQIKCERPCQWLTVGRFADSGCFISFHCMLAQLYRYLQCATSVEIVDLIRANSRAFLVVVLLCYYHDYNYCCC